MVTTIWALALNRTERTASLCLSGEETGWRGFLLPALQPRYGARGGAFIVGAMWAFWQLPFFFLLTGYRGFGAFQFVGFVIGIVAGSVVATWLYYGSGQSILAVAVWHAS